MFLRIIVDSSIFLAVEQSIEKVKVARMGCDVGKLRNTTWLQDTHRQSSLPFSSLPAFLNLHLDSLDEVDLSKACRQMRCRHGTKQQRL